MRPCRRWPSSKRAGSPTGRRGPHRRRTFCRCCACTAGRRAHTCGVTCFPRSRQRGAERWRRISPASATRRPIRPATFERHVEAIERFRRQIGLDRVVLVRPRHRRFDRPALGMRSPGRRARPGDHQHGLLSRRRVDRDREDDANPDPGRGARGQPLPRRRSPRCSRRPPASSMSARSTSTGRCSPPRKAAAGCSSSIAPSTSTSSSPTKAKLAAARGAHADPVGRAGRVPPASTTPRVSRGRFPAPSSCCSRAPAISSSRTSRSAAPRK